MSDDATELKTQLRAAESKSKTAERALKEIKDKRFALAGWSAVAGFALFVIGGQWFPGYQLDSTAEAAATERADMAVSDVLAELCAERFLRASGLETRLADLGNVSSDWGKTKFIREGAWASDMAGEQPDHATADKCMGRITERASETTAKAS